MASGVGIDGHPFPLFPPEFSVLENSLTHQSTVTQNALQSTTFPEILAATLRNIFVTSTFVLIFRRTFLLCPYLTTTRVATVNA